MLEGKGETKGLPLGSCEFRQGICSVLMCQQPVSNFPYRADVEDAVVPRQRLAEFVICTSMSSPVLSCFFIYLLISSISQFLLKPLTQGRGSATRSALLVDHRKFTVGLTAGALEGLWGTALVSLRQ